jgi:hypothetical protein
MTLLTRLLASLVLLVAVYTSSSATETILGRPLMWPGSAQLMGGTTSNAVLDGVDEAISAIFRAPVAGVLTAIKFAVEVATTQGANPYLVELQGVSATTGLNDLTPKTGATTTYAAPTTDDQVLITATLGTPYTVTAGEDLAAVVRNAASSHSNITVYSPAVLALSTVYAHPYGALAIPTNAISSRSPSMAVVIDGTTYPVGLMWPFVISSTQAFVTGGVVEIGNRFVAPVPLGVVGVWWNGIQAGDIKVHLYDNSTTGSGAELISPVPVTMDKDLHGTGSTIALHSYFFPRVSLTKGSTYYVTIEATSATSNTMNCLRTQASGNANLVYTAGGIQFYRAQRNDNVVTTDFTLTDTDQCMVGLWVDGLSDGVGAGGGGGVIGG